MIFQLPYIVYPEDPTPKKMGSYGHFKAPLHSRCQRWSFGAMNGRSTAKWQKFVSDSSVPEMLLQLVYMGFKGLYLDRVGYADRGADIERQLSELLQAPSIISLNEDKIFWDLRDFEERLKASQSSEQWSENVVATKSQIQKSLY